MSVDVEALAPRLGERRPRIALGLGSGLGALRIPYADIGGFPRSAVSGHAETKETAPRGGAVLSRILARALPEMVR